jgi:hypothetical protein
MADTPRGLMALAVEKLHECGLSADEQAAALRHIEQYLGFYNRAENAPRLAGRSADAAVNGYLRWLALQPGQGPDEVAAARMAITLLYSDVFGLPLLTRS